MTQPRRRKTEEAEPEQPDQPEPEAEEAEPEEPEDENDELEEEEPEEPGLSLKLSADRIYIELPRDGDEADTLEALAKVIDGLP